MVRGISLRILQKTTRFSMSGRPSGLTRCQRFGRSTSNANLQGHSPFDKELQKTPDAFELRVLVERQARCVLDIKPEIAEAECRYILCCGPRGTENFYETSSP